MCRSPRSSVGNIGHLDLLFENIGHFSLSFENIDHVALFGRILDLIVSGNTWSIKNSRVGLVDLFSLKKVI